MYDLLICISIYIVLIFLLFHKVQFKTYKDEFISQNTTKALKGYSIIIIVICHFYANTNSPPILFVFTKLGYLGVSIFLFLSGYGVAKSFQENGFNKFLSKRFKKVYLPFIIINIITLIVYYVFGNEKFTYIDIITYSLGIKLIDGVLWFVKSILIFYICFYLLFKYLTINKAMKGLFCITIIYPIICYSLNLGSEWYTASFNFFTGTAIVFYKDKIDELISRKYNKCLILFSCLFVCFVCSNIYFNSNRFLKESFCYLSAIIFTFIVIQILYKVKLSNRPLLFIGSISYEIYLVHMKVYYVGINEWNNINKIVPFIIVTMSIAFIFNKAYSKIIIKQSFI